MTFFHAANSRGKITGEYDYERGRFSLRLETATTALAVLGPYEKSFFAYDDSEENATDKCLHAGPRKPTRLGHERRVVLRFFGRKSRKLNNLSRIFRMDPGQLERSWQFLNEEKTFLFHNHIHP